MRRCSVFLIATLALLPAGTVASAQERDGGYEPLYDMLWNVVSRTYYDPDFRGTDWPAVRDRYRGRARSVRSDEAFGALASEMLAEIGSSHLRVRGPRQASTRSGIAARLVELGGAHIVSEVAADSDALRQGLAPGDRLISDRTALAGEAGSVAVVEIERCSGEAARLEIRRERAFWPPPRPHLTASRLSPRPGLNVGLIRVTRFDDDAAPLADQAMAGLMDADALVIDLRSAIGGNMSALRLASYFVSGAEPAVALLSRQRLQALGRAPRAEDLAALPRVERAYSGGAVYRELERTRGGAVFWTEALPQRFDGPVYVLIGANTRSAAEAFAWFMRRQANAVLVGEPTAGSLLSSRDMPLGEGWWVTVPVHGVWGPDAEEYSDRPVLPHVAAEWTREALCAGRDVALETAVALVTEG